MESNKYAKGKIYKITDVGYNKCYYGSTCESLANRMGKHRSKYRMYKEAQNRIHDLVSVYHIFDEYDVHNCKIELVESYPCDNIYELHRKEGEYIRNNECVNKLIAGRSPKEYREDNKEAIYIKQKAYRQTHIDMVKEKDKQYYETNKDIILERIKQYYETNKAKIKEHAKEPHSCDICGGRYTQSHKQMHLNTKKHAAAVNVEPVG